MNFNRVSPLRIQPPLNTKSHPTQKNNAELIGEIVAAIFQRNEQKAYDLIPFCSDLNLFVFYDSDMRISTENKGNTRAYTPLLMAILINNLAIANLILIRGANPDLMTPSYTHFDFPLRLAVFLCRYEMIDLLHRHGANMNQVAESGYNTLTMTLVSNLNQNKKKTVIAKLEKAGLDKRLSKTLLNRVELAHIWGHSGQSSFIDEKNKEQKINLSGMTLLQARQLADTYFTRFLASYELTTGEREKLEFMKKVFKMTNTTTNLLRHACNGEPIVIYGGYTAHCITLVIYKEMLGVQNRAKIESQRNLTTQIYHLPNSKLSSSLIHTLQHFYTDYKEFNEAIKKLNLTPLASDQFSQKYLKGGYCAWGDGKAAIHTLLLLEFGTEGKKLYKKFTHFTRAESLRRYSRVEKARRDEKLHSTLKIKWENKYKRSNNLRLQYYIK